MGRMGSYLTWEERLRRIGELLLKGVYLWADATEAAAAQDGGVVGGDAPCADEQAHRAAPTGTAHPAYGGGGHADGLGQSHRQPRERKVRTLLRSGAGLPPSAGTSGNPDSNRRTE